MSLHRFYITPDHWNPEELALLEEEAHHCHEVLRCKPGDKVTVFNGRGVEASAKIIETERQRVTLSCINVSKSEPLRARITLGQAIPKKKNMDLIVQKATELGTHRIAPILSERTVVRLDKEERRRKQAKWQRVALEASKQSGQNWLPEVMMPMRLDELLELTPAEPGDGGARTLLLIASLQPGALSFKEILAEHLEHHAQKPERALVLIGPEGDFTPAEIGLAMSAGCQPFTLGPIVLRTETAALYSLSILGHELF